MRPASAPHPPKFAHRANWPEGNPLSAFDNVPRRPHILLAGGTTPRPWASFLPGCPDAPAQPERHVRSDGLPQPSMTAVARENSPPWTGRGRKGRPWRDTRGEREAEGEIQGGAARRRPRSRPRRPWRIRCCAPRYPSGWARRNSDCGSATASSWGSAATARRCMSACRTTSSGIGSAAITPPACWRPPRRLPGGRCGCRSRCARFRARDQ